MYTFTLAETPLWITAAGTILAVITFSFGIAQYAVAQRWKRQEFVAKEVEKFFGNPSVATACLLLDYSVVAVTPEGRVAVDRDAPGRRVIDDSDVLAGLALHISQPGETERFEGARLAARVAFDAFFTELEKLSNHVASGVVKREHLIPYLAYWLAVISEPKTGWKDARFYRVVEQFIDGYGYVGVRRMIRESATEISAMADELASSSRRREGSASGPHGRA